MKTNHTRGLPPMPGQHCIVLLRVIVLASSVLAMGNLSSCNTTAGLGRDMEHAGRAIENTAGEVHSEMHR